MTFDSSFVDLIFFVLKLDSKTYIILLFNFKIKTIYPHCVGSDVIQYIHV